MYGSASSGGSAPSPGRDAARNQRYSYLTGRLHNRQLTMEEATELFTLMQAMLQTSEAARAALMRVPPPPPGPISPTRAPPSPGAPAPSGGDELLLVGLLAMGAGAGLLAAMTKRIQEATPTSPANPSPATPATSRKG